MDCRNESVLHGNGEYSATAISDDSLRNFPKGLSALLRQMSMYFSPHLHFATPGPSLDELGALIEWAAKPSIPIVRRDIMIERHACVTGFRSSGIGQAIVRRLCRSGYRVSAVEIDRVAGELAAKELQKEGLEVDLSIADLADPYQVCNVFDSISSLDLLVNNAGYAGPGGADNLANLTLESFQNLLCCNLCTAFSATKEAVQRFFVPQRHGRVIFLSSNNGSIGMLGQLGYGAAKHSLSAMVRVLAVEYAGCGITFNCVSPGIVETNGTNWRERRARDPLWAKTEAFQNPVHRLGQPDDIAAVIEFLASDDAAFVNGVEIPVDGGLRATGVLFPGFDSKNPRQSYVEMFRSNLQNT